MVHVVFASLAALFAVSTGLWVLLKNAKHYVNRLFFLFSLVLAGWFVSDVLVTFAGSASVALAWSRVGAAFLLFLPALMLHLSTIFPLKRFHSFPNEFTKLVLYIPSVVLIFFLGSFVETVRFTTTYGPQYGIAQIIFAVYFVIYLFLATRNFIKSMNEPDTDIKKMQHAHAVIALTLFFYLSGLTDILLPAFGLYSVSLADLAALTMYLVLIYAIRRYYLFVRAPVAEQYKEPSAQEYPLVPNTAYVMKDKEFKENFAVFLDQVLHGKQGICITRENPKRIMELYQLKRTPIVWITERDVQNAVAPHNLEEIAYAIDRFSGTAKDAVVFLDGIEYLASFNNFVKVLHLLQDVKDRLSLRNANLLVPVSSEVFNKQQLRLLQNELNNLW